MLFKVMSRCREFLVVVVVVFLSRKYFRGIYSWSLLLSNYVEEATSKMTNINRSSVVKCSTLDLEPKRRHYAVSLEKTPFLYFN